MPRWVALLRAVNLGGASTLPMADLRRLAAAAGLDDPRTYVASGNLIAGLDADAAEVRRRLEAALHAHAGRAIGVLVRSAAEIAATAAANPFLDAPGSKVAVLFTDDPLPADLHADARGLGPERMAAGPRAIFIHYPNGMADTKLRLPAMQRGTARNMNTVAKLAELSAG
jgi:uncharacterized protein (DUF1697 family)